MSDHFGWKSVDRFWQMASLMIVCIALVLQLRAWLVEP